MRYAMILAGLLASSSLFAAPPATQAATSADPDEQPVLLWVDYHGGHGQGKPLHLRVRDVVDRYVFCGRQLGLQYD